MHLLSFELSSTKVTLFLLLFVQVL